jgi:hypothetical protein
MPGFINNVQGRKILFKILKGFIETANPFLTGSIKNMRPGLIEENTKSDRVMGAIGIGDKYLPLSVVRPALTLLTAYKWSSRGLGASSRKEVRSFLNSLIKYSYCSLNF